MAHTTVTGTVTFQSEQDGRAITRAFPAFAATTDTPYTDLVDRAVDLVYDALPPLPEEYGWVHINESINEAEG